MGLDRFLTSDPGARVGRVLLYLLPLVFLAVFFLWPLLAILQQSLAPGGRLALDALRELVVRPYYAQTVWFTFWQAALSTLLTLAIGLPGAYVFGRYQFRGRELLKALTTIPFVMPTVVVAAAFRSLLGPNSHLNSLLQSLSGLEHAPIQLERTLWLILLAHVFYNYTVVIRVVGNYWANLSRHTEEAAGVLGANRRQAFFHVTLPALAPALMAAALLVFLFCFTSFGVILILGGPGFSTIETEIYRQAVVFLKFPVAAALSLLQIVFTYVVMLVYTRFQRRIATPLRFQAQSQALRPPATGRERLTVALNVALMLVLLLSPLLALVGRSLTDGEGNPTLAYYQELPVNRRGSILHVAPLQVVANSVRYGLMTVILATLLGGLSAWQLTGMNLASGKLSVRLQGWLDALLMLPLGVSAVTLGFGYIVALGPLRTSPLLIPLAHTLIAFPFVVRSILPVLRGIHPHLRESAAVLGASPWQVWREVDLPIVGRALLVGAVFAFTISMGEFGATSFIARPGGGTVTLPIAINRFLGQPGALNFGQALALSAILMVVCAAGFVAIERFRYGEIGEF